MGNFLTQPNEEKFVDAFEYCGKTGVAVSMQGWRISMEDAHIAAPTLSWLPDCGFFGVFDGHGGSATSEYCKNNLLNCLERQLKSKDLATVTDDDLVALLNDSFIIFDDEIRNSKVVRSGSTAICGFITPTSYIISNLGDSRCVLCRNHQAQPLSVDHKPSLELEKKRIMNAGGFVSSNRVNGDLAVSRSFGDFDYKTNRDLPSIAQQVSCEPDVRQIPRDPLDNYLIFACDGIWDVFPNPEDLIPVLDNYIKSYETLGEAVSMMLDCCLKKNSRDNMTMLVVPLEAMPEPDPELVKKRVEEERLKEEERLRQLQEEQEHIVQEETSENKEGMP